ncbi:UNVERIFIED_CONTAM: hypothetical protein FKN15_037518 [Acipenser sinensis]
MLAATRLTAGLHTPALTAVLRTQAVVVELAAVMLQLLWVEVVSSPLPPSLAGGFLLLGSGQRISSRANAAAGYNKALDDDKQASPEGDVLASPGSGELASQGVAGVAALGDAGFTALGDAGFTALGDAGFTALGDAGFTALGDAGFTALGDAGFTALGDAGFTALGDADLAIPGSAGLSSCSCSDGGGGSSR